MAAITGVLLVTSEKRVNKDRVTELREQLAELLPNISLLVLDDGMSVRGLLLPNHIA